MWACVHRPDPRLVVDVGLWITQILSPRDYIFRPSFISPRGSGGGGSESTASTSSVMEVAEDSKCSKRSLKRKTGGGQIPSQNRWLRLIEVRTSYLEQQTGDSSVVAPALGEAVFTRLCKSGVWLQVGPCWPPVYCRSPRRALYEESHTTADRWCPVEGCRVRRGHLQCPTPLAANACPEKRRVRQETKRSTTQATAGSAAGTGHRARGGRGRGGEAG